MQRHACLLSSSSYVTLKLVIFTVLPASVNILPVLPFSVLQAQAASYCDTSGDWKGKEGSEVSRGGECTLNNFDPTQNDGRGFVEYEYDEDGYVTGMKEGTGQGKNSRAVMIDGDRDITLKGDFGSIAPGTRIVRKPARTWDDLSGIDFLPPDSGEKDGGIEIVGDGLSREEIWNDFNKWRENIGSVSDDPEHSGVNRISGGRRLTVTVEDPVTGDARTIQVYDEFQSIEGKGFNDTNRYLPNQGWETTAGDGYYVPDFTFEIEDQRTGKGKLAVREDSVGLNLARVKNGGELNIDIDGDLRAQVKQGKLFMAEGEDSTLNWIRNGVTRIDISADAARQTKDYGYLQIGKTINNPEAYAEKIVLADGSEWVIRSLKRDPNDPQKEILDEEKTKENIRVYNDYLRQVVDNGGISPRDNKTGLIKIDNSAQRGYDGLINQVWTGKNYYKADGVKAYKVKDDSLIRAPDELLVDTGTAWDDTRTNFLFTGNDGAHINLISDEDSVLWLAGGIGIKVEGKGSSYTLSKNNSLTVASIYDATVIYDGATGYNGGVIRAGAAGVRIVKGGGGEGSINENGETYINDGTIISEATGSVAAMEIDGGRDDGEAGLVINRGTITGGYIGVRIQDGDSYGNNAEIEFTNAAGAVISGGYRGMDIAGGGKKTLKNEKGAIINGGNGGVLSVAVRMEGAGQKNFTNEGTINSANASGVWLDNEGGSFVNKGEIYVGRDFQTETGQEVSDTRALRRLGVQVVKGTAINERDATITLGSLTEGSAGMQLNYDKDKKDAQLVNRGTIILKDGWVDSLNNPRRYQTFGMRAYGNGTEDSNRKVAHYGTIEVAGIDAIGVGAFDYHEEDAHYTSVGGASVLLAEGSLITIGDSYRGFRGATPVFARNYGAWADGDKALVVVAGTIDMGKSYGGIGVHARMGASIRTDGKNALVTEIREGDLYKIAHRDEYGRPVYALDEKGEKIADLNEDGTRKQGVVDANQIAYYVYGRSADNKKSSVIENLADDLRVKNQSSTIFYAAGGAEFRGNGQSLTVEETGKYSTLIVGMGTNRGVWGNSRPGDKENPSQNVTQVITNDARLELKAEGSMGIFIGGGANGVISDLEHSEKGIATVVLLNGDHAVAGAVDGRFQYIDETYEMVGGKYTEYDGSLSARPQTTLTNYADIKTGLAGSGVGGGDDVTAFISRYGGLFINEGNIELMNGRYNTGIHVLEHGKVDNRRDVKIGSGIGLHVEGENGLVKAAEVTNSADFYVNDGRAGVLLDNAAFLYWHGVGDTVYTDGTAHGFELAGEYADSLGREHGKAAGVSLGVNNIVVRGIVNGVENSAETGMISFGGADINASGGTKIQVSGESSGIRTATSLVEKVIGKDGKLTEYESTVTIDVSDYAVGYDFRHADSKDDMGIITDKDGLDKVLNDNVFVGKGYTINVTDQGIGFRANTSGVASFAGTINIDEKATGEATGWLAGTTAEAINLGVIRSQSDGILLVDLTNRNHMVLEGNTRGARFFNFGTLEAARTGVIAVRGTQYDDLFILGNIAPDNRSSIRGVIDTGEGTDMLVWDGGLWDGSFTMGAGANNHAVIVGGFIDTTKFLSATGSTGDGDVLELASFGKSEGKNSGPARGGSFEADDLSKGINFGNNWETLRLSNADLELTDDLVLDRKGVLDINGNSRLFVGKNANRTVWGKDGLTINLEGVIDMTPTDATHHERDSDAFKDRFTIKGDLVGKGGEVWLDTWLESDKNWQDIAPSDQLVIDGGHVSGTTALVINGDGIFGSGAETYYEGIKVIDAVNGATTTDNAFIISDKSRFYCRSGMLCAAGQATPDGKGALMTAGSAYVYRLIRGPRAESGKTDVYGDDEFGHDWYLRSGVYHPFDPSLPESERPFYKSTVPVYEAYAGVLNEMSRLPTLQQRVGNRRWIGNSTVMAGSASRVSESSDIRELGDLALVNPASLGNQQEGIWVRWEARHSNTDPRRSLSGADHKLNFMNFQIGADFLLSKDDARNVWVAGFGAHYRTGKARVRGSVYGSGEIKPDGLGLDAMLTWYGQNGAYLDLQAGITAYKSDLTSDWTKLDGKNNEKATNYAISAELGQTVTLGNNWALTPQVQLQYLTADIHTFRDKMYARVSLSSGGESLMTRAGLAATTQAEWVSDKGDFRRMFGYGIANVYYDVLGGDVNMRVGEASLRYGEDRWASGLGVGGSYNWGNDKYSLYSEVEVRSSLESFGDSYGYGGTVGFRHSF